MRITLIHNPGAGRTDHGGKDGLVALIEEAGHSVRYQSSRDDDWEAALDRPADLVVVAGGDGTVGRVARRMAGRNVPVSALPAGTANNIARTFGLAGRSPEALVRGWAEARRVKLDLGIVRGPFGEHSFVEGVGVGLFALLLARADEQPPAKRPKKRKGEHAGKAVDGALRRLGECAEDCEVLEIAARLDGEDISGRYLMLEAMNLPYVGPSLFLGPDADPGDGLIEVVTAGEAERARLIEYLEKWQDNRERLAVLPTRRGRRLEIEWNGIPLHIDDKLLPGADAAPAEIAGRVEVRMGEAAVEFLVPAA